MKDRAYKDFKEISDLLLTMEKSILNSTKETYKQNKELCQSYIKHINNDIIELMKIYFDNTTDEYALKMIDEEDEDVERITSASLSIGEFCNFYTFSVLAEPSIALPLSRFLMKRLRIAPIAIELTEKDEFYEKELKALLERTGTSDSLNKEFGSEFTEIVFGPGGMCEYLLQKGMCSTAIDISMPSRDYFDIAPKSIMGLDGCRRIVEKVLNTR